jgi:autotransporter-associated beta strand protein
MAFNFLPRLRARALAKNSAHKKMHSALPLRLECLEHRTAPSASWFTFAGNPQHTAISTVPSQPVDAIHWQTPVDLNPSGADVHYGSPVFTPANTVIIPIKTGSSSGFEVAARNGATGSLLWTLPSDYTLPPHDWLPPYGPTLTSTGRLYFPGNGGTVYYVNNPDTPGATVSGQLAFYGIGNYLGNPAGYNSTVFIDTPLTADNNGNIYFGFMVTGANPSGLEGGGVARIDANGNGTYVLASTAVPGGGVTRVNLSAAPALSNDGLTLYATLNNTGQYGGYLVALDSTTLATKYEVALKDPRGSGQNDAGLIDDSTATPLVAPDNTVFISVFGNPYNGSRGFLLHFSADLATEFTPGAFGWDDTQSIVPASAVPSYHGTSSFLIFSKYNNYVAAEVGSTGGDGVNKVAILDPYASEPDPNNDGDPNLLVMREVLTIVGPSPDTEFTGSGYPNAVREWCINDSAIDPFTKSALVNSEDGNLYRWDLTTNTLTQVVNITPGIGEPYTPTSIGPDGTVYVINGGTLFALGGLPNYTLTDVSSLNPAVVGQAATFTATLASTSGGPTPTGSITFKDGNTVLMTVPLVNGQASYTTRSLSAASHFITASYNGVAPYTAGSTTLVETVVNGTTPTVTYVSGTFAGDSNGQVIPDADFGTAGNQPAVFGVNAFTTIAAGEAGASLSGTIVVNTGTYPEAVSLTTGTQTLRITGPDVPDAVTINSLTGVMGTTVQFDGSSMLTDGDATSTTFAGLISGSGGLTKTGAGTLTLSGVNTYSGQTNVNNGTLAVTANGALGTTAGNTVVASTGTLDFQNVAYTTAEPVTVNGGTIADSTGTSSFAGPITLSSSTATVSLTGTQLILSGALGGTQGFTKTGSGTLVLSNTGNNYAGNTTISGGTLKLANKEVIPNTSSVLDSAFLDLAGFSETIDGLAGGGVVTDSVAATMSTLSVGANNAATPSFGGVIQDGSGQVGLTKTGSGDQTLTGLNTYTGLMNINGGTLTIGSGGAINFNAVAAAGVVKLNTAGVTLNGSGTINGRVGIIASNNTVAANNTHIDGVTITVPAGATGITVPPAATFAQIGVNSGVTINGGSATSTGMLVQGSAKIFNSMILGQNVDVNVNGGIAALQGDTLTPGTGNFVSGLLVKGGAIVDAGQLAASATPLPNGPAGNVGYYGDITGLFSGMPLGSTAHSTGGNTLGTAGNPFSLDTSMMATLNPGPNIPQAIRNENTGTAPFGALSNGVEQSFNYGAAGPQLGRMDTTAQGDIWNGNASLPLFQIEQLVFHDLDDNSVGFVTYGNTTGAAPTITTTPLYSASTNSSLTPTQAGQGTLVNGSSQGNEQMSTIRALQVTFSSFVFLDPNLQSPTSNRGIDLMQLNSPYGPAGSGGSATPQLVAVQVFSTNYNRATGAYTVIYTFTGPCTEFGSLQDGNYSLSFNAGAIQGGGPGGPALTGSYTSAESYTADFHRLFGDSNGDSQVDNTDLTAFNASLRTRIGQTGYRAYFDFDNNGTVDTSDQFQFQRRYKTKLNADGTISPIP